MPHAERPEQLLLAPDADHRDPEDVGRLDVPLAVAEKDGGREIESGAGGRQAHDVPAAGRVARGRVGEVVEPDPATPQLEARLGLKASGCDCDGADAILFQPADEFHRAGQRLKVAGKLRLHFPEETHVGAHHVLLLLLRGRVAGKEAANDGRARCLLILRPVDDLERLACGLLDGADKASGLGILCVTNRPVVVEDREHAIRLADTGAKDKQGRRRRP